MKELKFYLLLSIFFFTLKSFAQDTIYFKKGLMVNAPAHYGREAIVTDLLAYQLYTGSLVKPVEGGSFGLDEDGDSLSWRSVVPIASTGYGRR
jgi:hypothetical protein